MMMPLSALVAGGLELLLLLLLALVLLLRGGTPLAMIWHFTHLSLALSVAPSAVRARFFVPLATATLATGVALGDAYNVVARLLAVLGAGTLDWQLWGLFLLSTLFLLLAGTHVFASLQQRWPGAAVRGGASEQTLTLVLLASAFDIVLLLAVLTPLLAFLGDLAPAGASFYYLHALTIVLVLPAYQSPSFFVYALVAPLGLLLALFDVVAVVRRFTELELTLDGLISVLWLLLGLAFLTLSLVYALGSLAYARARLLQ